MKKLIITILATLLILSLVGCAGTNETADPEFSASDTDTSADTSDNEKDSNIPEFNYTGICINMIIHIMITKAVIY